MSKKKWIAVIIGGAVVVYLLISKAFPSIGVAIDNALGPSVTGFFSWIHTSITTSPIWIQYDIYFSMIFGGTIVALLMWQGHNAFNKVRGAAVKSAAQESGWQTTPTATPTIIPTATTQAAPQPVATPTPTVEPKKEAASE